MKAIMTVVGGVLLALGLTSAASAGTRVGELGCQVHAGNAYIVGSSHRARCVFVSVTGHREHYKARVTRVGLDVGYTSNAEIVWAVFAPTDLGPHALSGAYVGASADATAGIGGGANVLVGGNASTISLQPVSLKSENGFAIGAGAAKLALW